MHQETATVAFVMPCLNEAATIEWCVRRASEAIRRLEEKHGVTGEVIVADNGSTDGSQALAEACGARVVPVEQRGYGAALQGGFAATSATYLVMGDSDCSYDFLEAIPMIEKLMGGADFCMGSRFKGEIKPGAMPWKNRYIGNPLLSGILRMLFRTKISDAHCGIRAITNEAYKQLGLSSSGMEFASEMVLKSVLRNLEIAEVPVTLSPDKRGRPPHLNPWSDGLRHLIYMLLLSPTYLFLLPAAVMFVFGVFILAVLLMSGSSIMVDVGGLRFGNHWAVVGSASLIMAVQTALMGVFALVYSYREGFRQPTDRARFFLRYSRLQYWLGAGLVLMLTGLAWAISITVNWISTDFGSLNEIRGLIVGATLVVTGAQIFFAGFLMSIVAGNRSAHSSGL